MRAHEDITSEMIKASPFRVAFAERQAALAQLAACDAEDHDPNTGDYEDKLFDKCVSDAITALREAEWKLLRTPAGGIVEIRWRAMVVQEMFSGAWAIGNPTDNVHRLMLNVLVSEILSPIAEH